MKDSVLTFFDQLFGSMDAWNIFITLVSYITALAIWFYIWKNRSSIWPFLKRSVSQISDRINQAWRDVWINHCYLNNPVKRDRWLYSGEKNGIVIFSVTIAVLVPFIVLAFAFLLSIINLLCYHFGGLNLGIGTHPSTLGIYDADSKSTNILWAIVSQYMDPGNLNNSNGIGSVIAVIMATSGIVCLTGLLVSAIVNIVSQRTDRWKKGLIQYDENFNNYVVLIGDNEQTSSIVRQSLKREGVEFVLIQTRKDVEKARMDLELKMEDELEERIVFYAGERTSSEDIAKLRIEKAVEIYILGEDISQENEKDHDAFNANCLEHISDYIKEYKKKHKDWNRRLRVHVDFEYQSTFTAFKATHLYQKLDRDIEFVPFNIHEIWAKKVLVDNFAIIQAGKKGEFRVQRYNPIDTFVNPITSKREGITEDCDKSVHLIIMGMNQMGTALATQAALLCHFPNFSSNKNKTKNKRTTITFIDDHAKVEADYLMGRFATLFELSRHRTIVSNGSNLRYYKEEELNSFCEDNTYPEDYVPFVDNMTDEKYEHLLGADDRRESFLDIEWEFIQGNVASDSIKKYVEDIARDPKKTVSIAICFNHSQQAIATAMYLPSSVYNFVNQVLVYQQNCFDIVNDVSNGDVEWKRYPNLFPFGMIESSYTENQFDNNLAKLFNYQYHGDFVPDETLLRKIDEIWDQLGIVLKLANINLADSIFIKYRSMGITNPHKYDPLPQDLGSMAYSEHLRWATERLMIGFRCLTKIEQEPFVNQKRREHFIQNQSKKRYMSKERAHLDICSSARLKDVDPIVYTKENDKKLISKLPELLKFTEWVGVLRLSDVKYENSRHVKFLRDILTNDTQKNLHFQFIQGVETNKKLIDKTKHSFWMAETVVTQAQWQKVMGVKSTVNSENYKDFEQDDMPVVNVSKQDVDDFLDILRKRTGLYFTLPSLKEWRYAAQKTLTDENGNLISYEKWVNSDKGPVKVSQLSDKQQSPTNLKHIVGNVWQWTREEDDYHRFEFCGGSWRFTEREARLTEDYWHNAWEKEMKSDDLGFRLIWKFDIRNYGAADLSRMMLPQKKETDISDKYSLIKNWFSRKDLLTEKPYNRMKHIKAGRFVMGANERIDKSADKNEMPRHVVEISNDFYMCDIPVTQYLWNLVNEGKKNPTTNRLGDNLPQTDVSWNEIMAFIETLNKMKAEKKLQGALPENTDDLVFRLPTEAEWEYAAKEGIRCMSDFENADLVNPSKLNSENCWIECEHQVKDIIYKLYSGSDEPEDVAWFEDSVIRDVALKQPNALGIYDMSGNIWEWCLDFYVWDMYDKGNVIDPIAQEEGCAAHVFRGGSWRSTKWDCRSSRASFWIADHKSNDLGFRLVLGKPVSDIQVNGKIKEL